VKKLSVVVPYRDRPEHLDEFAPALHEYLADEGIPFEITIVNQADDLLFNRAKLLNVGFLETYKTSDYTAFHDVDMLPVKPNAGYHYTETGRQMHSPTEWSMGGISMVNNDINWKLNGWANSYWGWGGEDRNYCHRFHNKGIQLEESQGYRKWAWGKEHFRELQGYHDPARKEFKKPQQKVTKNFKNNPELNDSDGLNSCVYEVLREQEYDHYTMLDVDLSEE
jgi:beta-1,4-galactosyltransferase 1